MDVWQDLQPLFHNREVGFPAAVLFGYFWEQLGAQPGTLTITTAEIAKRIARDRSTILEHIKTLHRFHDLIHVRSRSRQGRFILDVYRPAAGHAEALPDRQRALPGMIDEDTMKLEASEVGAAHGSGFVRKSEEPQRSGMTGEPQRLASETASRQEGHGESPTSPAGPWGKPHGPSFSAVGKTPRGRGENPTGQETAENTAISAEIEAVGKTPCDRGENPTASKIDLVGKTPRGRGENPTALPPEPPPAAAPPHAPRTHARAHASLVPKKEIYRSTNGTKDPKDPNVTNALGVLGGNPEAVGFSPRTDSEAAVLAELDRRIQQQRRNTGITPPDAPGTARAIAEAVRGRFSASAQKDRLVAEMKGLVCDPETVDWLYGYAADLLLVHGQSARSDAGEIFTRMQRLLAELREFRELRQRNRQEQVPRGKVFNARVMAIARAYGIPTPRQLKAKREAERQRARC